MTNILEGVQFREPLIKFPHWNPKDPYVLNDTYGDWTNVPEGKVSFSKGIQLRCKPSVSYKVTILSSTTIHKDKNAAMSVVAQALESNKTAMISAVEGALLTIGPDRKLQYKTGTSKWQGITIASSFTVDATYTFRIRPDFYHIVDSTDPISRGSLDFHDIEDLAKYVDNRIRTNGMDFRVTKVKY